MEWPKKPISWISNRIIYYSIPFTWNLPQVQCDLHQASFEWDFAVVGGPAVYLIPDFFKHMPWVRIGKSANGVMQKINPLATKTSVGCVRKCQS